MMSPPEAIRIGGRNYSLRLLTGDSCRRRLHAKEAVGSTLHPKLELLICTHQADPEIKSTVLHELLHAIWYDTGVEDDLKGRPDESAYDHQERLVSLQGPRLYGVLMDNPELVAWLTCDS